MDRLPKFKNETDEQYKARCGYMDAGYANLQAALKAIGEGDFEKAAELGEIAEAQCRIGYGDYSELIKASQEEPLAY